MSTRAERDEEHERLLRDVITEERSPATPPSGPAAYLVGAVLVILLVLWLLPSGVFPERAQPNKIPPFDEVVPASLDVPDRPAANTIDAYVIADDPSLKLVASRVVTAACGEPDKRCYADALFYFVRDNIGYVHDPVEEYYELPQETLLAGAADCDGHAILLASLLRSVGVLTRFDHGTPGHVAVEAWVPQRTLFSGDEYTFGWRYLDATCSACDPGERRARP
ncbi:transglutaminase domain-containing protein [Candidatus Woesearchaeota archaeon]|nr:transglutaminase domain-containing protein [Candidatus Woesearchaeota archaeon]